MKRLAEAALATLLTTGVALAHDTGTAHQEEPLVPQLLPPTLFLAGASVLVTVAAIDHRDMLPRRQADLGVGLGALGVLAGIVLLFA